MINPLLYLRGKFAALGVDAGSGTPEELAAYVKSERAKYAKLIQDAGIKAEE